MSFWRSSSASHRLARRKAEAVHVLQLGLHPELGRTDGRAPTRWRRQRSAPLAPCSTSETPSWPAAVSRRRRQPTPAPASAAPRRSGSVTISTNGVPPRLKSTMLRPRSRAIRPGPGADVDQSSPRPPRGGRGVIRMSPSFPGAADRDVVLTDLVGLRVVGIEVVLAVEDRSGGAISQSRAPSRSSARSGSPPRSARRQRLPGMGEADRAGVDVRLVAEGLSAQPQNIFVLRRELDVDLQPDDWAHRAQPSAEPCPSTRASSPTEAAKPSALLERVGGLEQLLLGEGGGGDLEADRQLGRALRCALGRGQPGRDRDRRDPGKRSSAR